ncbi:MAG: hypothetical protein J3K34DRAFT_419702 [Monoraphidium minutum]|nr:MAG: hypothetical protein J3K34DRAFT_419702 [Monoraphidium minutum]
MGGRPRAVCAWGGVGWGVEGECRFGVGCRRRMSPRGPAQTDSLRPIIHQNWGAARAPLGQSGRQCSAAIVGAAAWLPRHRGGEFRIRLATARRGAGGRGIGSRRPGSPAGAPGPHTARAGALQRPPSHHNDSLHTVWLPRRQAAPGRRQRTRTAAHDTNKPSQLSRRTPRQQGESGSPRQCLAGARWGGAARGAARSAAGGRGNAAPGGAGRFWARARKSRRPRRACKPGAAGAHGARRRCGGRRGIWSRPAAAAAASARALLQVLGSRQSRSARHRSMARSDAAPQPQDTIKMQN